MTGSTTATAIGAGAVTASRRTGSHIVTCSIRGAVAGPRLTCPVIPWFTLLHSIYGSPLGQKEK